MDRPPPVFSWILRAAAAWIATLALTLAVWTPAAEPWRAQPVKLEREPASGTVLNVSGPPPKTWSLNTGGWVIRVDGAEVAIPALADQIAAIPRASFARALSPYDYLIARHAKAEGFDWRLITAVAFEESRFNPTSLSSKGAYGLMQVRPIAAEAVGESEFHAPEDNVRTGVRYLRQLYSNYGQASGEDRLRLVLAAYNIGPGHLRDAQNVARRFGYDPNRWFGHMELMLPLLEQPPVYSELPNGFAQGSETVAYVDRILRRYARYLESTAGTPTHDAFSSSAGASANG